jgi:hypothetical protein
LLLVFSGYRLAAVFPESYFYRKFREYFDKLSTGYANQINAGQAGSGK